MNVKVPRTWFCKLFLYPVLAFSFIHTQAQNTVVAGPQYARSSFHQWLWGKHYRKEWITPVTVPGFLLDTAAGGLKPYQEGGGRQSKSLRLTDPNGKEYVIRSIDKSFGKALPPVFQGTFIESIINDQVPLGHPYTAVTFPIMSGAAKIYYTHPRIVYIPQQPALDSFNKEYGNRLYLFEQRPDENWEEAEIFGNSKKIVSTEKMLEKIYEDNDNRVDQLFYVRSRLFDMLIGDASRHEDQWRWASFTEDGKTIYKAIPRDRDQAFARFDGVLVKLALSMANLGYLQTFKQTIPDVELNNYPARNLDRQIANEPVLEQWVSQAKELQRSITDEVIEQAVRQLPAETFPISGNDIISKLRSRRDDLDKYATRYYLFLAKEVEVVGTKGKEFFHITRLAGGKTRVTLSKINKNGNIGSEPFYSRVFLPGETKEVRLYGLSGNDVYKVDGEAGDGITVRIIGGTDRDSIIDRSASRIVIYDDHQNDIISSKRTKMRLSNDPSIHAFKYDAFKYNAAGFSPKLSYNFEDKLYVGFGYKILRQGWRKEPFKTKQEIEVNYSVSQNNFSFVYKGEFRQVMGKWNMNLDANYDLMRWTNYFGLGNETKANIKTSDYYQMETRDVFASLSLNRPIGKHANFSFGPVYNSVRVLENKDKFISQTTPLPVKLYEQKYFAGARAEFFISRLNDKLLPTKGIYFLAGAQYLQNMKEPGRRSARYNSSFRFYIPLHKNLVLLIRPSVATVTGQPEFYQHVAIGGSRTLRGYKRDRFWGTSSLSSGNELQWLFNMRTKLFNGKAGLLGFCDVGRVWEKDELSNTWHTGYGGGFLISPFNKIVASVIYGVSTDGGRFHIRAYRSI